MRLLFVALAALVLAHVAPARASMELARQKNCLACHAVDKPMLGPAYQDVATRYRGQSGAVDMLTAKVLKGGAGVWGSMAMPPNPVTPAEARQLVLWALGLAPGAAASQLPASPPATAALVAQAAAAPLAPAAAKRPERPADALTIERGKYLVNSVLSCGNCHSPRTDDNAVIAGRELSGGRSYDTPMFYVTPGNLTPDPETGLGRWSADDLKRALTRGIRPNGLPLAPMMPVAFFKAMTEQDLDAVVGYLRSLPPQRNPTPGPVYRKPFHVEEVPDAQRPFTEREAAGDEITRGRYLATLGHCLDCHTPVVDGKTDFVADGGRGGKRVGLQRLLVPNITSHPSAGLGGWTDAEIRRALTQGVSRDGRRLQYPMPWPFFATLRDGDVSALVAWLRSLPPKQ
jgi:cytochrome c551/c552